MSKCERCERSLSIPEEVTTRLYGGRFVMLCLQCKNAWHEEAHSSPLWATAEAIEADHTYYLLLATSGKHVSKEDITQVNERELRVRTAFFCLSGKWLAEGD